MSSSCTAGKASSSTAAGQPQPTSAPGLQPEQTQIPAAGSPVTLHCSVAGISTSFFSTAGLDVLIPLARTNAITWYRRDGVPTDNHNPNLNFFPLDFTCTSRSSAISGFYTGASVEPTGVPGCDGCYSAGIVTYRTKDGAQDGGQVCIRTIRTSRAWFHKTPN